MAQWCRWPQHPASPTTTFSTPWNMAQCTPSPSQSMSTTCQVGTMSLEGMVYPARDQRSMPSDPSPTCWRSASLHIWKCPKTCLKQTHVLLQFTCNGSLFTLWDVWCPKAVIRKPLPVLQPPQHSLIQTYLLPREPSVELAMARSALGEQDLDPLDRSQLPQPMVRLTSSTGPGDVKCMPRFELACR